MSISENLYEKPHSYPKQFQKIKNNPNRTRVVYCVNIFLVPVIGVEPTRGVAPHDFEFEEVQGGERTFAKIREAL
jgi:hypothetical protein